MSHLTVLITGATKGLGRATALEFARFGHRVIGMYSTDVAAAEKLERELLPLAGGSFVVQHDVRGEQAAVWDRPEIRQAERLVLINNACAPFTPRPFHLLSWHEVETGFDVALKGSWLCSRAVLRPMARQGSGAIVNVLTTALKGIPPKGFAGYTAAKHALRGLTLALAAEYGAKGVRVFSVSPGFMSTELTAAWDARLTDAMRSSASASDPAQAAVRIRELVESPETPGQGEDYEV